MMQLTPGFRKVHNKIHFRSLLLNTFLGSEGRLRWWRVRREWAEIDREWVKTWQCYPPPPTPVLKLGLGLEAKDLKNAVHSNFKVFMDTGATLLQCLLRGHDTHSHRQNKKSEGGGSQSSGSVIFRAWLFLSFPMRKRREVLSPSWSQVSRALSEPILGCRQNGGLAFHFLMESVGLRF